MMNSRDNLGKELLGFFKQAHNEVVQFIASKQSVLGILRTQQPLRQLTAGELEHHVKVRALELGHWNHVMWDLNRSLNRLFESYTLTTSLTLGRHTFI